MKAFQYFSKLISVLNVPFQPSSLIHFSTHLVNVNDVPNTMTSYEKTNKIETWSLTGRSPQSGEEDVCA